MSQAARQSLPKAIATGAASATPQQCLS